MDHRSRSVISGVYRRQLIVRGYLWLRGSLDVWFVALTACRENLCHYTVPVLKLEARGERGVVSNLNVHDPRTPPGAVGIGVLAVLLRLSAVGSARLLLARWSKLWRGD